MNAPAWTPEEAAMLIPAFQALGGYAEHGSAKCVFCRPTNQEIDHLLETGQLPEIHQGFFSGRNIYSLHWWSGSLRDSLALARKLLATIPAGAVFAWHFGSGRHVFRKKRGGPCPQPQE